jgi:hypothetical protein
MTSTDLLTPILDGAIRSIKFFNGRMLTGEDLTTEQAANRDARERLGLAAGDGVAFGLEVSMSVSSSASSPSVTVQPGLAINRCGKPLSLTSAVDISLVQPAPTATTTTPAPAPGSFSTCQPPQATAYISAGAVYLLTLAPVQTNEGKTQISGLGSGATDCNTKYLVDAVELRLLQLSFSAAELGDAAHLRNLVASKVFGYPNARAFATDPFGATQPTTTFLEANTTPALTTSDVPLATLYWTAASGLVWVDMWSVRRAVAGPCGEWPWDARQNPRRLATALAMLLQFQGQVADLYGAPAPAPAPSTNAKNLFNFLPPAGVLPINGPQGFVTSTFFAGLTIRDPIFIEGAKVEPLLRASLCYPPIDCSSGEMIFLYHVRENRYAIDTPTAGVTPPVEYVVFATGQMPYFGDARFDIARFDYSSYADGGAA